MLHVGRFVAPPARLGGREVGGVGLHEQSVEGDHRGNLAHLSKAGIGDRSRDRQEEAPVQVGFRQFPVSREAVDDPTDQVFAVGGQRLPHVGVRLAVVNDYRECHFGGDGQHVVEEAELGRFRGPHAAVVQADLAHGDRGRVACELPGLGHALRVGPAGPVGVKADGGVYLGPPGGEFEATPAARRRHADGDHAFDTGSACAAQHGGKVAFEMIASFTIEAAGEVIEPVPPVNFGELPEPESLPRYQDLMAQQDGLPFSAEWALREHGVDVGVVNAPWSPSGPSAAQGICMWIRADGVAPPDPKLHMAMLAYQSDESVADNLLVPFGVTWSSPEIFFVSLDHAMWFHRPIDLNEWHFVEQRPLSAAHGRGVACGYVWSQDRKLIASFTQEALMRFQ